MTPRASRCFALMTLAGLLACAGCDGGDGGADAGSVDAFVPSVEMSVASASTRSAINGVAPRPGFQYLVLEVLLQSLGDGDISIASSAFSLTLEDGTVFTTADASSTDAIEGGCKSRVVPENEQVTCFAVFVVELGAAPPQTLRWSDASHSATADVPPVM